MVDLTVVLRVAQTDTYLVACWAGVWAGEKVASWAGTSVILKAEPRVGS